MTAPGRVMWKYTIPITSALKTTTAATFHIPGGDRFRSYIGTTLHFGGGGALHVFEARR